MLDLKLLEPRIRRLALDTPADIEVHAVNVASTAASAFEPVALSKTLSDAEKQKAERFKRPGVRSRYVFTRAALRLLLAKRTDQQIDALRFNSISEGRPFLCSHESKDRKHPDIDFNLSHSGDLAIIAIGNGQQRIGIDLERVKQMRDLNQLAKRVLTPIEIDHLNSAPNDAEELSTFFRYWTLKEAYLKALGTGLQVDMTRIEIALQEDSHRFRLLPDRAPQLSFEFEPEPGYRAALLLLSAIKSD